MTFLRIRSSAWFPGSQQHARRNALVASTALTQRRLERLEVEDFLAEHAASRVLRASASADPRPAAHSA
ncbi:MAG: hypothetical protein QOF53_1999 [Nocardioidaceae bacterium]|nr:hypothetical protein [Nocardioidaceae bacterium]